MADMSGVGMDQPNAPSTTSVAEPASTALARRWRQACAWVMDDPGRVAEVLVSFMSVAFATALIARTLHLDLVWADTTPTGGDMGAHVWGPRYLLDNLLPHGRLSGWTPDWYGGFPAYQFYMVIPSLLIVLVHVGLSIYAGVALALAGLAATIAGFVKPRLAPYRFVILGVALATAVLAVPVPYNRAFKIITGIGLLSLPLACWAFAKLSDLPFPAPPLAAGAALLFAFNREPLYNNTGNIIGGNFHSTMAGEFAFSISLTISILYLGVAARGLRTGRHRALAAALFALAGLCHLIPAFFVLACTAALLIVHPDRQRFRWLATMVPVAGLLTAWWVIPFAWRSDYVNDMGWERLPLPGAETSPAGVEMAGDQGSAWYYLLPPSLRWLIVVALIGVVVSLLRRYSVGLVLACAWLGVMGAFTFMPQARLWNARLLPFMYLSMSLLAAIGAAEVIRLLAAAGSGRVDRPLRYVSIPMVVASIFGVLLYTAMPLSGIFDGVKIFGREVFERKTFTVDEETHVRTEFLGFSTTAVNPVSGWAAWNYSGLERKSESPPGCSPTGTDDVCKSGGWPEYRDLMSTMAAIGADPDLGCGRAFWEYEKTRVEGYGTPMAPMLLPYWTDGCIGSMEGLYFESSATVPHHFLMQAELSQSGSQPQRGLPYPSFDIDAGVEHLQMLGVRYYLASTTTAVTAAAGHPDLTEVAVSGAWHIYLVADTDLVTPLDYEPVVVDGIDESQHGWLPTAVAWFLDPDANDVFYTHSGPSEWAEVEANPVGEDVRDLVRWVREQLGESGPLDKAPDLPRKALPDIEVSDISADRDSISFRVSEPGVPVLVRTSYFPNWVATGAEGPFRVAPNLMVVVPTANQVTINYTRTPIDLGAAALSLVGLVGLVVLARRPQVEVEPWTPSRTSLWIDRMLSLPDDPDLDAWALAGDRIEQPDQLDGPDRLDGPDGIDLVFENDPKTEGNEGP